MGTMSSWWWRASIGREGKEGSYRKPKARLATCTTRWSTWQANCVHQWASGGWFRFSWWCLLDENHGIHHPKNHEKPIHVEWYVLELCPTIFLSKSKFLCAFGSKLPLISMIADDHEPHGPWFVYTHCKGFPYWAAGINSLYSMEWNLVSLIGGIGSI